MRRNDAVLLIKVRMRMRMRMRKVRVKAQETHARNFPRRVKKERVWLSDKTQQKCRSMQTKAKSIEAAAERK